MMLSQVAFDTTINLGNILTIISFLGGGIAFVVAIKSRVDAQSERLRGVEDEVKQLSQIMIMQGRHDERLTAMDMRVVSQGRRLDDTIHRMNRYLDIRGAISEEDGGTS